MSNIIVVVIVVDYGACWAWRLCPSVCTCL